MLLRIHVLTEEIVVLKIYDISAFLQDSVKPLPKTFIEEIETEIMNGNKIGLFSAYPISYMQGLADAINIKTIILIGENGNYICGDANTPPQWYCTGNRNRFVECISQKTGIRMEDIFIKAY